VINESHLVILTLKIEEYDAHGIGRDVMVCRPIAHVNMEQWRDTDRRKIYPSAILFTTNPTFTVPGLNLVMSMTGRNIRL
jgi:hypothetical protein